MERQCALPAFAQMDPGSGSTQFLLGDLIRKNNTKNSTGLSVDWSVTLRIRVLRHFALWMKANSPRLGA